LRGNDDQKKDKTPTKAKSPTTRFQKGQLKGNGCKWWLDCFTCPFEDCKLKRPKFSEYPQKSE